MNLKKTNLPPSPRARHARKPIIDITNLQSYSLDKNKTNEIDSSLNNSLDGKKLNQQTNTYLIRGNQQKNLSYNYQPINQLHCKNHKDRKAISFIQRRKVQYFCFQCSLYQARNGNKIKGIQSREIKEIKNSQRARQNQIQKFIKKNQETQKNLRLYSQYIKQQVFKYMQGLEFMIRNYNNQLEQQVKNLKQVYLKKKQEIQKIRQHQMKIIGPYVKQIEQKFVVLSCNRLDVMNNLQQCLHFFSEKEYQLVMSKYWKQIEDTQQQINNKYPLTIVQNFKQQINEILGSLQSTRTDKRQFTFSKSHKFETPTQQIKFKGIPIINSNSKSIKASPKQKNKLDIYTKVSHNSLVSSFGYY